MKSLKSYLKQQAPAENILVQARVDKALVEKFRKQLKKDRVYVSDFFEGVIKKYLDEAGK